MLLKPLDATLLTLLTWLAYLGRCPLTPLQSYPDYKCVVTSSHPCHPDMSVMGRYAHGIPPLQVGTGLSALIPRPFPSGAPLRYGAPSPPIQVRESQLAAFREEAKSRKKVLLKLGHIDEEGGCGKRGNYDVGECGRYQEGCETACAISIEAH